MYNNKVITICTPCLNNYSGLYEGIESIEKGSVKPDRYCILDNGRKLDPRTFSDKNIDLIVPERQISLAAAWNVFLDNVPETRIIINDDIIFYEDTLKVFLDGMVDDTISFPYGVDRINAFSFFSIPDSVVKDVGRFDEEFYPAYFEDNSYDRKLVLSGRHVYGIPNCNIIHKGSQTIKKFNSDEMSKHHIAFQRCQDIYVKMWGGNPGHETYLTKFNR
jgi:hypothetical protein